MVIRLRIRKFADQPNNLIQIDVLLAINGGDITSASQLQELMAKGAIRSVRVFRAGSGLLGILS